MTRPTKWDEYKSRNPYSGNEERTMLAVEYIAMAMERIARVLELRKDRPRVEIFSPGNEG